MYAFLHQHQFIIKVRSFLANCNCAIPAEFYNYVKLTISILMEYPTITFFFSLRRKSRCTLIQKTFILYSPWGKFSLCLVNAQPATRKRKKIIIRQFFFHINFLHIQALTLEQQLKMWQNFHFTKCLEIQTYIFIYFTFFNMVSKTYIKFCCIKLLYRVAQK